MAKQDNGYLSLGHSLRNKGWIDNPENNRRIDPFARTNPSPPAFAEKIEANYGKPEN